MAALPPETIHVKRKRGTEDAPVDFLCVDGTKRYRTSTSSVDGSWVYQRRTTVEQTEAQNVAKPRVDSNGVPIIQTTTAEEDEKRKNRPKKALKTKSLNASAVLTPPPVSIPTAAAAETTPDSSPEPVNQRKFHLKKPNSPLPTTAGVLSKKRGAPAVFVERGPKRQRSQNLNPQEVKDALAQQSPPQPQNDDPPPIQDDEPTSAQYKRPGVKSRHIPDSSSPSSPSSSSSKPTTIIPAFSRGGPEQTEDLDQIAQMMNTWTIHEITKNLETMNTTTGKFSAPSKPRSALSSKFKPKAPKQRYFERPEVIAEKERAAKAEAEAAAVASGGMDIDSSEDTDDDYVLETYERVPAERLRDQAVPAHRVGLLVFDSEPDMVDFFYGNEDETDDEFPEDEDDENAEDYYANEYPDDDLEWDDEFDQNAYHYMNQNASDNEEYDVRDFEDDVWERSDQKNPFLTR
ncbi:hypothetical protein QBC35DRAFT_377974 [Podospora australis]|uniref:Transcription factor Iwr1 domain-containing protein n=1 Tax=Podospora australis TaxID=1536484 RepID=A0AAN7ALD0_9PEZI|nr:hypothetical protein QBC35DRAFT_377974 [Podospora australis]